MMKLTKVRQNRFCLVIIWFERLFVNPVGIQSPSDNGSGTYILCGGGDWTSQSSSENMTIDG